MTESFEARIAKAREHVNSISPADIEARLASDPKTLLLDVRDEGGRSAGVIPGSTNVSLGTLFFKADQTSPYHDAETFPDLDHPIVCTCTGGGQAAVAADLLKDYGYTNVTIAEGGAEGWAASGRTIDDPQ